MIETSRQKLPLLFSRKFNKYGRRIDGAINKIYYLSNYKNDSLPTQARQALIRSSRCYEHLVEDQSLNKHKK